MIRSFPSYTPEQLDLLNIMRSTFLVVVFLCGYYILSYAQTGVKFLTEKDFVSVVTSEKPIYLDFYTDWCVPCKVMDKEVFQDKLVGDYYNEHFVSYKINAESEIGEVIARKYDIGAYPTSIFLDEDLNVISRKIGGMPVRVFLQAGETALETRTSFSVVHTNIDSLYAEIQHLDKFGLESRVLVNHYFNSIKAEDFEKQQNLDLLFSKVTFLDYDNMGYIYFIDRVETFKSDTARVRNLLFKPHAIKPIFQAYSYDQNLSHFLSLPLIEALTTSEREKDPVLFAKVMSERRKLYKSIHNQKEPPFMFQRGIYRREIVFYSLLSFTDSVARAAYAFQQFLLDGETPESVFKENQRIYRNILENSSHFRDKKSLTQEEENRLNLHLEMYLEDLDLILVSFHEVDAPSNRIKEVQDFKDKLLELRETGRTQAR